MAASSTSRRCLSCWTHGAAASRCRRGFSTSSPSCWLRQMNRAQDLSHAFIAAHPVDAARVLEHLPPDASADLFAQVPVRILAPTVRAMMPFMAAQAIVRLPADAAALLLNECGAGPSAAIIRYVPESRR